MAKYRAIGTQLQLSDMAASNPSFTTIAQLTDIGEPGGDTEEIDVTTHDSPASARETIASFTDSGELSIEGIYDPALPTHDSTDGLAGLRTSGEVVDWKLLFPTSPSAFLLFSGWVKSFKIKPPLNGALMFSATIRLTGDITFPA